MSDLTHGLTRLGLDPRANDGTNLKQLWQLYQDKEAELSRSEDNHKKEMKAVEKYIESIRKVSGERDTLTEELEAENEALKDEVRQLREELNKSKQEIKEALQKKQGKLSSSNSETEKALQDNKEKAKKLRSLDGEVKKLKFALLMEKRKKSVEHTKSGEGDSSRSVKSESRIPVATKREQDEGTAIEKVNSMGTKSDSKMATLDEERRKCNMLEDQLKETESKWKKVVSRYKTNEQDLKNKLDKLTREMKDGKAEVASNQGEILRLKAKQGSSVTTNAPRSEAEQLTLQLLREQEQTHNLQRQLKEVDGLRRERDALAEQLETLVAKDRESHVTMATTKVLENEIGALKDQLHENLKKQSDLLQDVHKLQKHNSGLSSDLSNAKESIKASEETIGFLREELRRKVKVLTDTFDLTRGEQSKMESEVASLQHSLSEERRSLGHTNGDLKVRLEAEEHKNQEMNRILKEKTEEIAIMHQEVSRLSLNSTRSEERIKEGEKQRRNVDSRNRVLEEELDKLWSQLKEVMERHATNEMSKTELEGELSRLTNEMRDQQQSRTGQQAEQLAAVRVLERAQQRAQTAEKKIPELQEELDNTLLKLETVQTNSSDLAASRKEVQALKEDLMELKIELQEEKVNSSHLVRQLEDIQGQLKVTQERERHLDQMNSDLKHQLLTAQSQLTAIKDKQKNAEDMHSMSEQGKQSLQETASSLQAEVHRLHVELTQTANQLENQSKKYMNLKLQTKEKMENARDIFNRQKTALVDRVDQVQNELNDVRGELEKENNDKGETKKKNQTLLTENRQLMERMAENEDLMNDKNRNISSLEYRTKFLEQENGMLQDRITTLSRQRTALEKVVREYRLEKQKEDIYKAISSSPPNDGPFTTSPGLGLGVPRLPYSSGLGNSLSTSIMSGVDVGRPAANGLLMRSQAVPASESYRPPPPRGGSRREGGSRVGAGSDGMIDDTEGS